MPLLQSVDRIIATSTHPVYVIDWNRSPEQSAPEILPHPIEEWLKTKCPEVEVGRLCYSQGQRIRAAVLILGFNAEQADAFIADLSYPPSQLPKSPDFYFIRCSPKRFVALIQWHVLRVRQRFLGRLRNLMRATPHKPRTHSKENQHDRARHH